MIIAGIESSIGIARFILRKQGAISERRAARSTRHLDLVLLEDLLTDRAGAYMLPSDMRAIRAVCSVATDQDAGVRFLSLEVYLAEFVVRIS